MFHFEQSILFELKRTCIFWGEEEGEWAISAARKQLISAQIKPNSVVVVAAFAVRAPQGGQQQSRRGWERPAGGLAGSTGDGVELNTTTRDRAGGPLQQDCPKATLPERCALPGAPYGEQTATRHSSRAASRTRLWGTEPGHVLWWKDSERILQRGAGCFYCEPCHQGAPAATPPG